MQKLKGNQRDPHRSRSPKFFKIYLCFLSGQVGKHNLKLSLRACQNARKILRHKKQNIFKSKEKFIIAKVNIICSQENECFSFFFFLIAQQNNSACQLWRRYFDVCSGLGFIQMDSSPIHCQLNYMHHGLQRLCAQWERPGWSAVRNK